MNGKSASADTHCTAESPKESSHTVSSLEGEVSDYYDNDANPLLEVTSDDGRQVLIPAAEEFIAHIDFEGRTIRFVLPEGLIGLQQ